MKIAITGANSSVGLNLLAHITRHPELSAIAGVRSDSAFATLPSDPRIEPRIITYTSVDRLVQSLSGADCIVHLAGVLIEGRLSTYARANIDATGAVAQAAKQIGVKHLVFISVIGASTSSKNAYFHSKGAAEQLVIDAGISSSIIRTPILLGPGTAGASSLVGAASQGRAKVLGGGNYHMRPLDIDDLCQAILNCCQLSIGSSKTYELVGPESISYRDLIQMAAKLMGKRVEIASIPIWAAKLGASLTSRIKGAGITPTVVDVITADEIVERNQAEELNVTLTSLADTLAKITGNNK